MTPAPLLLAACLAAPLAARSSAPPGPRPAAPVRVAQEPVPDPAADRAALEERRREALEELAEWCTKKKVFVCRAEVYGDLLRLDPDHEEAHRGLGHLKDADGNWHENEQKIAPKNWNKRAEREFPERRAAVEREWLEGLHELLAKHAERLDEAARRALEDEILTVDPADARVRTARGEALLDGAWVLAETARAKDRRGAIREAVRAAISGCPPIQPDAPDLHDENLGVDWRFVLRSEVGRCLTTGDEAEGRRLLDAAFALREVFAFCLGAKPPYPKRMTLYTLAAAPEKERFVASYPRLADSYREFLLKIDGACLEGDFAFAQWAEARPRRIDGMVRLETSYLLGAAFGVTPDVGWAFEGLGLYLTRELVGTRLTWFATPSEYDLPEEHMALQQRLLDPDSNWMAEARVVLEAERRPKLEFVLAKGVNQLTTKDLLYSYVLAAFLLEAEPQRLPGLLERIGAGTPSAQVFEESFGVDLETLDRRVRRWLDERR